MYFTGVEYRGYLGFCYYYGKGSILCGHLEA